VFVSRQFLDSACFCTVFLFYFDGKGVGGGGAFKWKSLLVMSKDKWYSIIHYSKELAVAHQRAHFDTARLLTLCLSECKTELRCYVRNKSVLNTFLLRVESTYRDICLCMWALATLCMRCRAVMSSASHFGLYQPGIKGTA